MAGPSYTKATEYITDPIAKVLGHGASPQMISDAFGPELAALLLQVPIGLGTTRFGEWVVNLIVGSGAVAMATYGTKDSRTKHDFYELGAHFLQRLVVTRPEDIAQVLSEVNALRGATAAGSAQGVRAAFIRSPEEVTGYVRAIQQQANLLAGSRQNYPGDDFSDAATQSRPGVPQPTLGRPLSTQSRDTQTKPHPSRTTPTIIA